MRLLSVMLLVALPALALAQDPAPAQKKPAKGEVYKYVDEKGVVHYTDKPPSDDARPAPLPPLQTYKGGTAPDLGRFSSKAPASAAPRSDAAEVLVQLVTPSADETFRGGERTVPVAVMVTPALTDKQRLVYYLDGTPRSPATTDTAYSFTEVDRGAHTAAVAVVDAAGNELARSSTVTFHVKPPIVKKK